MKCEERHHRDLTEYHYNISEAKLMSRLARFASAFILDLIISLSNYLFKKSNFTMLNDYKSIRESISTMLKPVFELLIYKQTMLENHEWRSFVKKTKMAIIANPEQYLGNKPVPPQLTQLIVQELFLEFLASKEVVSKNP